MSFSLAGSHSYPGKNILTHKTLFPVAHQEHSSTEQHSTMALRYSRYRLTLDSVIFTRSLRGLYEICTRSGFCKAREQGKAAGMFSTLPFSALRLSNHFYSKTKEYVSKRICCVPLQSVRKINATNN